MKSSKTDKFFDKVFSLKNAVIWTVVAYGASFLLGGDRVIQDLGRSGLFVIIIILVKKAWLKKSE